MLYLFYLTRNIIGLILVLSPLAGLLYIDLTFSLSIIFMSGLLAGIPLWHYCSELLNFRLRTSIAAVLACAGSFFCASGAENLPAAFLAGLAAGGLALNLPPCTVIGWFRASKTLLLAAVWTVSLALGTVYGLIMERNTYLYLFLSAISALSGTLFFLEEPFVLPAAHIEPSTPVRRSCCLKTMFFAAATGFAGFISCLTMPEDVPFDFFVSPDSFFIAGIILGPLTAGFVSDNKSVYNGCILMIFLGELAAAGAAHGNSLVSLLYAGRFACGLLLSGMLVTIPVLTYYLSDAVSFRRHLAMNSAAACVGMIAAFPVAFLASFPAVSGLYTAPIVFIMLILSFFTLFSAWKHRLFLLKSG